MVVFTCNHCGDSLQKPRVEKHYQVACRTTKSLTCVDCLKDFRGEEFVAHNKCITEAERYSAQGSTPAGMKKGEAKQESWTEMIKSIIDKELNLIPPHKNLLNTIASSTNVPRKRPKFMNFIKSSSGGRVNMKDVEAVWDIIEKYKREQVQAKLEQNGTKESKDDSKNNSKAEETEVTEVVTKKKKKKNKENEETNGKAEDLITVSKNKKGTVENVNESKHAKNKRKAEETEVAEEVTKKKKKKNKENEKIKESKHDTENNSKAEETEVADVVTKKKKNKENKETKENGKETNGEAEDLITGSKKKKNKKEIIQHVKETNGFFIQPKTNGKSEEIEKFSFQDKILEVLNKKNCLSLKKLERKVMNAYLKNNGGLEVTPKALKKFNKILKKIDQVQITENKVNLILQQ